MWCRAQRMGDLAHDYAELLKRVTDSAFHESDAAG